jgi:hypothetical protein
MLATPPPKKPPGFRAPKTGRTNKKYYTIHNFPNTLMAVKLFDHEHLNFCVVSFSNERDALLMGNVIENHRVQAREWPIFNFADNQSDNAFRVVNYTGQTDVLNGNIYVQQWNEIDDLKFYCVSHFLDLITLNKLVPARDGFVMKGSTYKFEADQEFYTQRLEYLYEKWNG